MTTRPRDPDEALAAFVATTTFDDLRTLDDVDRLLAALRPA